MKISDEQYEKIGQQAHEAWRTGPSIESNGQGWQRMGRAAVAAVAPLLLAAPTPEERKTALRTYLNCIHNGRRDDAMPIAVEHVFSARLASLTAKPDPAVEAVKNRLKDGLPTAFTEWIDAHAAGIVADIDKARGEAQLDALPRVRGK